ncbi:MAG: hypothetical protein LBQ20_06170 [Rhodanobacter sp.]|jgi:hypothetical protein|nr:hypothetical protein [Rhodanobacter sp.]
MDTEPQSALLKHIYQIFPGFEKEWTEDNSEPEFITYTLHCVYMSFLPRVARQDMTDKQLKMLAELLSEEASKGGDPENAVDTCFLEHADQVGISKRLRPLLSEQATKTLYA